MAQEDRERWNAKYRAGSHASEVASSALVELAAWVPAQGRGLDVAGGMGRNALWLARRGLDMTVVDISEVALARVVERAGQARLDLKVAAMDLEVDPLPSGPFSLVLCCDYLQRSLVSAVAEVLAVGGRLLWIHPLEANLERHPKPGRRHLLSPGEARGLVESAGLRVVVAEEGWVGEGAAARCLARVVGERVDGG
ncbi:MAG: class I SAM-dependent methyltransferase [Myxococcota bacterium]